MFQVNAKGFFGLDAVALQTKLTRPFATNDCEFYGIAGVPNA